MKHTQKMLWQDFKEKYFNYIAKTKRAGTFATYKGSFKAMESFKKPVYLSEITPRFLIDFRAYLINKAANNHGKPNAVTRNIYVRNLKIAVKFAMQHFFLKKRDYNEVRAEKQQNFRKEYHSLQTLSMIKEKIKKAGDLYTAFLLGTQEGLRRGEIAYLEKSDYIPTMHAIHIHAKKYWQPKTATSERYVPLQPESEAAIIASIKRAPAASPYIINFSFLRKKKRSLAYITIQYRQFRKKNFPELKSFPHIWRHTFASQLLQHNAELKAVSELMGHSDIKTTARYAHLEFKDRCRAASLMPKF